LVHSSTGAAPSHPAPLLLPAALLAQHQMGRSRPRASLLLRQQLQRPQREVLALPVLLLLVVVKGSRGWG
jgi:hypothetical protein